MVGGKFHLAGLALATGAGLFWGAEAEAGHDHLYRVATQIEQKANHLTRDFQSYYGHSHEYRCLIESSAAISQTAHNFHGLVSANAQRCDLERLVEAMEKQADHLEDALDDVRVKDCGVPRHIHQHVRRMVDDLQNEVEHLEDDVDDYVAAPPAPYYPPVSYGVPSIQPAPVLPPAPLPRYESGYRGYYQPAPVYQPVPQYYRPQTPVSVQVGRFQLRIR